MNGKVQLPDCIRAMRIPHWSQWSESEYDQNGELAPITWICNCGQWLTLEEWADDEQFQYMPILESRKTQFLSEHTSCTAKCYKCNSAPVESWGLWCQPCEDKAG